MRLSFVIPAYNEQAYLGDCLRSILAQSEKLLVGHEVEIIVVNNASTDSTAEVARSFPGVIVVDEPRKGLTFARQAGFERATGTLIANVDSDSRLTPGWLEQVFHTFAAEPRLLALSGPVIYDGLPPLKAQLVRFFYLLSYAVYLCNRYVLRVGSMVQGGNFVLTRHALELIGGFNTTIAFYGEDTDIARRLNKYGPVRFTFRLKMLTSPRRLEKEGVFTTAWRYTINYVWTTFFKHPFTKTYTDHREEAKAPIN